MKVSEYIKRKEKRLYSTFIVNSEGRFYVDEGKLVPQKEFENKYTLPLIVRDSVKGDNPDASKAWYTK